MLQKILFYGIEIIFVYCNRLSRKIKFKVYKIFIQSEIIETQGFLENIPEL